MCPCVQAHTHKDRMILSLWIPVIELDCTHEIYMAVLGERITLYILILRGGAEGRDTLAPLCPLTHLHLWS